MPPAARKFDEVRHSSIDQEIKQAKVFLTRPGRVANAITIAQKLLQTKKGREILYKVLIASSVNLGKDGFDDLLWYSEKLAILKHLNPPLVAIAMDVVSNPSSLAEAYIMEGSPDVFINNKFRAAREGDISECPEVHKPKLLKSESTVFINGKSAIRKGDLLDCLAKVTGGSNNVYFDEISLQAEIAEEKRKADRAMPPPPQPLPTPTENPLIDINNEQTSNKNPVSQQPLPQPLPAPTVSPQPAVDDVDFQTDD